MPGGDGLPLGFIDDVQMRRVVAETAKSGDREYLERVIREMS